MHLVTRAFAEKSGDGNGMGDVSSDHQKLITLISWSEPLQEIFKILIEIDSINRRT